VFLVFFHLRSLLMLDITILTHFDSSNFSTSSRHSACILTGSGIAYVLCMCPYRTATFAVRTIKLVPLQRRPRRPTISRRQSIVHGDIIRRLSTTPCSRPRPQSTVTVQPDQPLSPPQSSGSVQADGAGRTVRGALTGRSAEHHDSDPA